MSRDRTHPNTLQPTEINVENVKTPGELEGLQWGKSGLEMDEERKKQIAYEYLCRLEEARIWMSKCVGEDLPPVGNGVLEGSLRNGVYLAKLAASFAPHIVQERRIFDADQRKFSANGLHFRHTDNINYFLRAATDIGLPEVFLPETTDIYDAKNMPRVIYCIHGLSMFLYKLGRAPPMQDLSGKAKFTSDEISAMSSALARLKLPMPQFRKIDGVLAGELQGNPDDLSSAMVAINQAVDQNLSDAILMGAMQNPMAKLSNIQSQHADKYRMVMAAEKRQKNERDGNGNIVLQHDEIQELINSMNRLMALQTIEKMVRNKNENGLLEAIDLLKPEVVTVPRTRLANSVLMNELTSTLQKNGMLRLQDVEASLKAATMNGDSSKSSINLGNANNIHSVVQKINCSLENGEVTELLGLLKSPCLKLEQHVLSFAGSLYFAELDYIRRGSGTNLSAEGIIRVCIFLSTVAKINEAAESRNYEKVFHLASEEGANLEDLQESMKTRYGEAMKTALIAKQKLSVSNLKRAECGIACKLLNHADIQDCIDMVNSEEIDSEKIDAVKLVNDAVQNLDHKQLFRALQNPTLELEKNVELKKCNMNSIKKETTGNPDQIQKGNLICEEDSLHYLCLLRDIQRDRSLLVERQNAGNSVRGNGTNEGNLSELWMEDILEAVEYGINNVYEAKSASFNLSILNMAVIQKNSGQTYDMLRKEDLNLKHNEFRIYEESKLKYLEELYKVLNAKEESGANGVWVEHKLSNNNGKVIVAYLNLRDQKHSWRKPRDYNGPRMSGYLGQDEILTILNNVNSNCAHGPSLPPNWDARVWTQFQARCRGNLVRHKIFTMLRHYYDNEQKIVKIQAYWKGRTQRKKYHQVLLEKIRVGETRLHLRSLAFYRINEEKIILIQRAWRLYKNDANFRAILMQGDENNMDHISVAQVRRYLHLLDLRRDDFDQELEMQTLKGDITKKIRMNTQLEKDIDTMDIKIGLLVKNRIDVQDVVAHSKLLTKRTSRDNPNKSGNLSDDKKADNSWTYSSANTLERHNQQNPLGSHSPGVKRGLKALKRESREKLESYQNLFYQLQTQPQHLAKLIHVMPQSNSTKFMETVLLTLYNFGANQREEYLLLRLFKTALEEEIQEKVVHPADIVTGNPLVVRMVISFYRVGGGGKSSLQDLLGPLITQVLEDKDLHINISPVDIYKAWVNSIEFDSGKAAGMPYDVTTNDALQYEEVRRRLARSISKLKQVTTMFLATIVKARHRLPYGLLYIAQILRKCLNKKFPTCPDKDVLKIVGNLIYYRYLNSAIVAPDAFVDINKNNVNVNEEKKALNNDQRRNLGSIAKVLQAAAMKKGFGEEAPHLIELNNYIVEAHDKFKYFFLECCEKTKDPETQFHMNAYTDLSMIAKPVIYISLQEICDTHRLLLQHRDKIIVPIKSKMRRHSSSGMLSEGDKLNELLNDLGGEPSLCSLVGAASQMYSERSSQEDKTLANLAKTEVCLTLTNKFTLPPVDRTDMDRLFIKTKQLLCSVLPCTAFGQGAAAITNRRDDVNLIGCLKSKTVREQEDVYWRLMAVKEAADEKATKHQQLDHTNLFEDDEARLPLEDCKRQILKNLQILERHGYVSSKDGCKAIVVSLAKDIINRKQYRSRRRTDILRLQKTILNFDKKSKFHEEQIEYYQEYLKQCLANLQSTAYRNRKSKKKVTFDSHGTSSSASGAPLHTASKYTNHSTSNVPNTYYSKNKGERTILRYSAAKLHEKGILIEIDGLPLNQFRNVLFEIVPASLDLENKENVSGVPRGEDGRFEIHAKFMGVRLEHVDIDIQELLQLQYEGVAVMNIFGKAKINVNLLLHLLNAKFYGRKRK